MMLFGVLSIIGFSFIVPLTFTLFEDEWQDNVSTWKGNGKQ